MKKIINGKIYNNETAETIYEYWNGLSTDDFRFYMESIHKTKKGTYFHYQFGGAMTEMAISKGRTTYGSEDLNLMTVEEVKEFLQKEGAVDTYEKEFGAVEEG